MRLEMRDKNGAFIGHLDNNEASLKNAGAFDEMIIHVSDSAGNFPPIGDETMVAKFEMSDEAYSNRTDSLRNWKLKQSMSISNANSHQKKKEREQSMAETSRQLADSMQLKKGQHCMVKFLNQPKKQGTIEFIGETHFKPGIWVGIHYQGAMGKNDGSIDGKRYFECPDNCGGFVRPQDVQIIDSKELPIDEEMDEI